MRIALLAVMVSGCSLYFGGGGGGGGGGMDAGQCYATPGASLSMRNPDTGQCQTFDEGDPCGPPHGVVLPNWTPCSSACLGRDQPTCEATGGCQVEMLGSSYWGCFPVEPNGAVPPPSCVNADAYTCASNDACIAVYGPTSSNIPNSTQFVSCVAETVPPPLPACSTLTTEMDCLARTDCDAVYNGSDCTCDNSGCVCKTEVFAYCESK